MESKNILLVIIAVCALFVVVFGIGLWASMPGNDSHSLDAGNSNSQNLPYEIVEYGVQSPEVSAPLATQSPEDLEQRILENKNQDNNIPGNNIQNLSNTSQNNNYYSTSGNFTENSSSNTPEKQIQEPIPTAWIERPTSKPAPTTAPRATTAPKKTTKIIEYWIQAGSFVKKSNAETRSEIIKNHGFAPQIQTREINGSTQYRVRIGPYENKEEAEKFLNWLKVLQGLEASYISQVTRTKSL